MISRRQVTCINKREHQAPYERITHIGGVWGKLTSDQAIAEIEQVYGADPNAQSPFFVHAGGLEVDVNIVDRLGRPYLRTTADSATPNNLLNLPECR